MVVEEEESVVRRPSSVVELVGSGALGKRWFDGAGLLGGAEALNAIDDGRRTKDEGRVVGLTSCATPCGIQTRQNRAGRYAAASI